MQFCNTQMLDNWGKNSNFASMNHTLEYYISKDESFRQILLCQDGGIMKYWAEHPDSDFDTDLFDGYEEQIVVLFRQTNKQNRAFRSLPADKLKEKSLDWYHQSKGSELKFFVAMKPALNAVNAEFSEQVFNYIENYMFDAYRERCRCKYPEGMPPQVFYNKVLENYGPFGLSLDCLESVLQEARGKVVHLTPKHVLLTHIVHSGESPEWKEVDSLQKEFDLKKFKEAYADGGYKKLRQAVKELISNCTQNLTDEETRLKCREIAKDEMRKVNPFTRWVNNESYPMEETKNGELVPLITSEERHWLRNIEYENSPGETGVRRLTTMDRYFCHFISVLDSIASIWAAQLLIRGIDLREIEKETGIVLSRQPDFFYYVDKFPDDRRGDCFVYDWAEAKRLLGIIKRKSPIRIKNITWDDEKECFKAAVLRVMEKKKNDGEYLFKKPTQWKAVYRFAIDRSIMYELNDPNIPEDTSAPQYAFFEKFAHELRLDDVAQIRIPFTKRAIDDINKENFARYNASRPWSKDGINDVRSYQIYNDLDDVYQFLEEEYDNRIRQAERSID